MRLPAAPPALDLARISNIGAISMAMLMRAGSSLQLKFFVSIARECRRAIVAGTVS